MDPNVDADESEDVPGTPTPAAPQLSSSRLPLLWSLFLALVAGGILAGIVLAVFPIFEVPAELTVPTPPPEIAVALEASIRQCNMLSAMVFLGSFGFLMSVSLGAGEAAVRRFSSGAAGRLVAGVVLATIVGALSGALGPFLTKQFASMESLVPIAATFLAQACMLGLFGAGVAAAVGLVAGGVRTAGSNIASGVMAGVVVAFLFPLVCALALPDSHTEVAIPGAGTLGSADKDTMVLALYIGSIAVTLGLLIPLGNRPQGKKRTS